MKAKKVGFTVALICLIGAGAVFWAGKGQAQAARTSEFSVKDMWGKRSVRFVATINSDVTPLGLVEVTIYEQDGRQEHLQAGISEEERLQVWFQRMLEVLPKS